MRQPPHSAIKPNTTEEVKVKLSANFNEALDQVKAGTYPASVLRIEDHVSKKGTRCVKVLFRIKGGDFDGRGLSCIFPLEGKAAGFFRKFVQAVKSDYAEGDIDSEELIGKDVRLLVSEGRKIEGERSYSKIQVYSADSISLSNSVTTEGDEQ